MAGVIATQEMELGNYQYAHDTLFKIHMALSHKNMVTPMDLHNKLMLLHSYVIVKRMVKM